VPEDRSAPLATYNVHGCVGTDGRRDAGRVAAVLGELGAQAVGLQEVDAGYRGPGGRDQLHVLARATDLHPVDGPTLHSDAGRYGNALLLAAPPRAVRRLDMSIPGREPRGALDVDVDLDGRPLRLVVTHLGRTSRERRAQIDALVNHLGAGNGRPVVLMGDFNEWIPWSRTLHPLVRRLGIAPAVRSFPSWRPMLRLDRIWASPPAVLTAPWAHRSPLARRASDHLPVLAGLRRG
jgi:endonuclease/exonuclease/phosphatase family metal-dependent hydrolase